MSSTIPRLTTLKKGEVLDEFTIDAFKGRGLSGGAITYSTTDKAAIKLFVEDVSKTNDIRYDKFKKEAELLKEMETSPFVMNCRTEFREYGIHQSVRKLSPYYAMELMDGDLENLLFDPNLTIDNRLKIAIQITKGMIDCHSKSICHRDLYSPNILYRQNSEGYECKIADFGSAKQHGKPQNIPYFIPTGNTEYSSPEAIVGLLGGDDAELDTLKIADIFALGLLLYEIITGITQEEITKALRAVVIIVNVNNLWDANFPYDQRREVLINDILPALKSVKTNDIEPDDIIGNKKIVPELNQLIKGMIALDYRDRTSSLQDILDKLESILVKVGNP